ncbi:multicopper oxidase family protein [Nisaea sp.]|uniref:multicopper oxidase family protein n=1 Tax=Nisaea sp. TaxID=2024842 RepID=UPI003B51D90A
MAATTLTLSGRAFASPPETLEARPGTARLAPAEYEPTPIWGYEGGVPGPTLRVKQGGRIDRRFLNALPQSSTVHWHGIRIDNAMDGVPELTQTAVAPGGSFDYAFTAPDAGTYWYHPHNRTWEQLARGLYGALVVEEPDAPDIDRDEVLLIDDWRLTEKAEIAEDFGAMHDWSHGGRIGNWITVNGDGYWASTARQNERLRLRLVNVANARIFSLSLKGLDGWIVALDGQPLETPQRAGRMVVAPAQRIDLIVDVTGEAEASIVSHERNGSYAIATFTVSESAASRRTDPAAPLPPNPLPEIGPLESARRAELLMEGGAMGGMTGAMMGSRSMDMRGLVQQGKVWAFNGRADMPDEPLISAAAGETIRIRIENRTGWPHAMHLHGHHFRKVLEGGALGAHRDTLLMDREEIAEIAFVADNPGDWLLHCHMVEHSAAGMMTWIRVA